METFSFSNFRFKLRLETFWIDSDLKEFNENFMTSSYLYHFDLNNSCVQEKIHNGKFFHSRDSIFKTCYETFVIEIDQKL